MADFTGKIHTNLCSPLVTKWQIILHFHCCFILGIRKTACNLAAKTELGRLAYIPAKVMICDDDYINKPER
jgi:hypothetical protein